MKVLLIGGERHGEWIDGLPDGVQAWVDLTHATTHRIRPFTCQIADLATGLITEAYVMHLAVHPDLVGPQEPTVVSEILRAMALNDFARTHGVAQEIPKEPAGSSLIVP